MDIVIPVWSLAGKHGGIRVLCELGTGLTRRGHRVRFLAFDELANPDFATAAEIVRIGPASGGRYLFRDLPRQQRLREAIERFHDADVLLANHHLTARPVHRARIRARKLYYIQAYEPDFYPRRWHTGPQIGLAKRSYRYPLLHVANCISVARAVHGKRANRVPIVPPGLDLALYHPKGRKPPREPLVVGTISRVEPWKGTVDCFEAVKRLRAREIALDFRVAFGNIPAGYEDVVRADDAPRDDRELAGWYRSLDVLVAAVYWGGAPYPPIEAMACGTAVVTTPNDHTREGVNALTAPQQDPGALASALERMLTDRSLRERLVAQGLRDATTHSWENVVRKMESILSGQIPAPLGINDRSAA